MKNRNTGILEVIWFIIGGLLLFIAVDKSMDSGLRESWYYYLLAFMALAMYLIRRKTRLSKDR
ncbi:MAG: hypothetical protein JXR52_12955 [Bacteroidales bacterium]|nr:hypothetical protein [Bacteroidales bacterium]MBN2699728.1 hypothetical protein [Bacteroidales bacterium]